MAPVALGWLRASINFWNRAARMPAGSLLRRAFVDDVCMFEAERRSNFCWSECMVSMLRSLGLAQAAGSIEDVVAAGPQHASLPQLPLAEVEAAWESEWNRFWEGLGDADTPVNPRTAASDRVHCTTYAHWFAPAIGERRPAYLAASEKVAPAHLRSLIRFRTGSHWLRVETGRWCKPQLPRAQRVCLHCSQNRIEDELHVAFECPRYMSVRRAHAGLFELFGGWEQAPQLPHTRMRAFFAQAPAAVASFVHACMERHKVLREEPSLSNTFEDLLMDVAPFTAARLLAPYASLAGASRGGPPQEDP